MTPPMHDDDPTDLELQKELAQRIDQIPLGMFQRLITDPLLNRLADALMTMGTFENELDKVAFRKITLAGLMIAAQLGAEAANVQKEVERLKNLEQALSKN